MAAVVDKINMSGVSTWLLTAFSIFSYVLDIFQDVLVIISSISSDQFYSVLFNQKIYERSFGYVMICAFAFSVVAVGLDTVWRGREFILVKKYPWIAVFMGLACLLNLGPVFLIVFKFLLQFDPIKITYKVG